MKRSTKQLLSMLLAIVMVVGLMAPAMAAKPMMGEVAETPAAAEAPAASRPAAKAPAKADLAAAGDKSTLDFGTVTAFAKGSAPAEGSSSADGKIKAIYGADGYVDTNKKNFDDGTAGTQRYRQSASTLTGTLADVIELKPTGRVVLKVWWVYNKGDREMAVYKLDGETVNTTTPVWTSGTGADNKLMISRINLPEAGTYYIGFPKNASDKAGAYVFKVEMTEVAAEPTTTTATLGTPTLAIAQAKDEAGADLPGKVEATVSGLAIGQAEDASLNVTQNAENVTVYAYKDGGADPVASAVITKWCAADAESKVVIDVGAKGTGSYTFKAVATQGESTTESAVSSAFEYVLPLAKPVLTAKAGDGKVNLSWPAVKEATSYEVYQGETKLTDTPTEASGVYYLEVTGLTNDTEYSFTVKAIRATPAADATSDAATATPVAPVGGPVTTTQYHLDITKVIPDKAQDTEVSTADLTAATTKSVDGGAATENARYFGITLNEVEIDGAMKTGYVKKRGNPPQAKSLSLLKQAAASIDFTVKGDATVTLSVCSTSGTNVSMLALVDDTGAVKTPTMKTAGAIEGFTSYVATDTTAEPKSKQNTEPGVIVAYGNESTPTTVEYTLTAGTYHIVSYSGFTGRDGRVTGIDVVDKVQAKPVTKVYDLDITKVIPDKAQDTEVAASDLTAATTVSVDGGPATENARYFGITLNEVEIDGAMKTGYVKKRGNPPQAKSLSLLKQAAASIDFTVKGDAKATLSVCSTSGTNVSMLALVDDTGAVKMPTMKTPGAIEGFTSYIATDTTAEPKSKQNTEPGVIVAYGNESTPTTVEYTLTAGTYHIVSYSGFTGRDGRITDIIVSDTYADTGDLPEVTVDWTVDAICGTPAFTVTPDNTEGTIDVKVVGPRVGAEETAEAINIYADKLAIVMYDGTGAEVASEEDNAEGDTHKATFTPDATGKYTFKVRVSRDGEQDLESAASEPAEFILPLKVPSINSVASNGLEEGKETASVTVSWTAVPEATGGYKLYCRTKGAADWGTAIEVPATEATNVNVTVPGLTVGTEYEFAAEAIRNAGTINDVAVTAETTAKSAALSAVVVGSKQTAWTTKVFGTSSTDKDGVNSVIVGDYVADFTIVDDSGKPIPGTEHKEEVKGLTGNLNTDPGSPLVEKDGKQVLDVVAPDGKPVLDESGNPVYGKPRVLLSSKDGAGKITEPAGSDGLLFHYTTVPAGNNYSLKAKVHVTRWFTRDTQNGLGLAALDRVPAESWHGNSGSNGGDFWNNSYMVGAARLGFSYDSETGKAYYNHNKYGDKGADAYTGYSYYMGLCSITKHGTPEGYDAAGTVAPTYMTRRFPLDTRIPKDGVTAKYNGNNNRFNTIGNYSKVPAGWSAQTDTSGQTMHKYELTDFILELKKTPTGYTSTAWTLDGKLLGTNTEYYAKGAAELSGTDDNNPYTHTVAVNPENAVDRSGNKDKGITNMDPSAEYVGFFTSRDTDAMFYDVEFNTWAQSEDTAGAELPPPTPVTPTLTISSGTSSNSEKFTLSVATNVDGFVTITQDGTVIATNEPIEGDVRLDKEVTLKPGANTFKVNFTVDPEQTKDPDWPPFTELDTATKVPEKVSTVTFEQYFSSLTNIYVSPTANSTGRGTINSPMDIHTAVSVVSPGQNIILLGGEYKLFKTVRINRGMDGTEEKPIYFMAQPGERVVLNGQGVAGTVLVNGADWWVFKDFEVVGSSSGSTGFQLSGSNNIVQNVDTHDNGSTGLTVGRLSSSDKIPVRPTPETPADQVTDWGEWPCNNKIINCSSYRNYDSGYNGADGFGAKETVGAGNVFDGCVAYWNADDGWDLFAKSEPDKGCLGVITLKNCITFQNGYEVRKVINPSTQQCDMEADGFTPKMNLDENGKIVLSTAGNGNGFKMGGNHLPGAHVIENSYAFGNRAKGFDSNNGPDIKVRNCTGYNNGDENVGLSSNSTPNYEVTNVISFKDENCLAGNEKKNNMEDRIKDGGTTQITNFYKWDGKKSSNGTKEITAANFASLTFDNTQWVNGAVRKADGSLDLGEFLKLVDVTDAGAGELTNTETPVETPDKVTNPPEESLPTGGISSGNGGGTIGGGADKPDEGDKPVTPDEKTYTAEKKTNINGDTEIVVKDQDGEVVADVKIPATISAPETKFDDVPEGHWAEASINNMAALGIVNGVGDNKYDMDSAVTRGTIATMLYRFANGKEGKTNPFTDVAGGQWFTDAIAWAADSGVVTGYSETTFGPNDTITREQLAVMLYRFAKLIDIDGTVADSVLADYNDVASVDDWAAEGMAWCVGKGIINGISADTLSPDTSATRAQTATMLDRFIALMK